jgi:putative phosphoesterase
VGVVGLISDTHGLVRPSVFHALSGVTMILHAGDVGDDVVSELGTIAPVRAVCGNTDVPSAELPPELELTVEGVTIHVSHGHELGAPTPEKLLARYGADVIVYGHTHRQLVVQVDGRWVVNPGAAGQRRFNLRPSVARLTIRQGSVSVEIVELDST